MQFPRPLVARPERGPFSWQGREESHEAESANTNTAGAGPQVGQQAGHRQWHWREEKAPQKDKGVQVCWCRKLYRYPRLSGTPSSRLAH